MKATNGLLNSLNDPKVKMLEVTLVPRHYKYDLIPRLYGTLYDVSL